MANQWEPEKYTAEEIHNMRVNNKIVVPLYQRGKVWKQKQKNDLIDSIKKGLPFGSILLYQDDVNNNYRIIDGLQRSSTIYEFISNPAQYFNEDDIDDGAIDEIVKLTRITNVNKSEMRYRINNIIIDWIKKDYPTMASISGMQFIDCAYAIAAEFPTLAGNERAVSDLLKPMLNSYISMCTAMAQARIPAIVIKGDESSLPLIFERINSKGSQLTKWQIYAATWSDTKIHINDELIDIIKFNKERFDEMVYEDEINFDENYSEEMSQTHDITFFDMIFGFGKMICKQFPQLFPDTKKPKDVESIGFNLINACLGFKNNEIENLNKNIRSIVGNDDDINKFLKNVISCIKIVDRSISITTKFKSNVRNNASPLHTELQICSMIASIFINKYLDIKMDNEDRIIDRNLDLEHTRYGFDDYQEKFKKNALIVYTIDVIQKNWSGTGDKRLNSIILNRDYYTRNIPKRDLEQILNLWFDNDIIERKEYQKVASPKEAERLLLNIIYSRKFTAEDQINDSKYDIEHLATKELMKKRLSKFNNDSESLRLPISSFGNLAFLPEDLNRGKKDKTIYQIDLDNIEQIENKFTFTKHEDLEWLENEDITKEDLAEKYNEFIRNRFDKLKEYIIDILYN